MIQLNGGPKPAVAWTARAARRLPLRLISRHWGAIAETTLPSPVAASLIFLFCWLFGAKLREAERSSAFSYRSLSDFFTRRLAKGLRPICEESKMVSPVDGAVTHVGSFQGGFLQQVKGVHYSLPYFLGLAEQGKALHASADHEVRRSLHCIIWVLWTHTSPSQVMQSLLQVRDGSTQLYQWTAYLSPGDYHRFHSPCDWVVEKRRSVYEETDS